MLVFFVADLRAEHFEIQGGESQLRILVYRAGLLRAFGHNHVISTDSINGDIWLDEQIDSIGFELSLPVASFAVDDPRLREIEGDEFPGEISEKNIRGTLKNMLGEDVLDAERFGEIRIVSLSVAGDYPQFEITADVTVRDQTHPIRFPVSAELVGNTLSATGSTRVTHEELGMAPFTAAFGTLNVADEMTIRYRIVATRASE